jgi:hypothetical protein
MMCRSMKKSCGIGVSWRRCLMRKKKMTSIIISTPASIIISITSQTEPSSSLYDENDESMTPKIINLHDIYEATNELHLVYFLADAEDIIFEQAVKDEK